MTVYLIFGHTGENSDYITWMVRKVFTNLTKANNFKNKLNSKLKELEAFPDENNCISYELYLHKDNKIKEIMKELDPRLL